MSVRVMSAVWSITLPDSEKLVLLALADCANDEGGCWPSMKTLADKCSKSDRTVQAAIKALVEKGHLSRSETPGKGCNYRVHPRSHVTPEAASPPKRTTQTPEAASDKPSRTIKSSVAKATSQRGSRIPLDWEPGPLPESVAALVAQWPPGREKRELEGFRDYWTSRTRDACRLDWDKTYHNRIRDQHDRILRENRNGRSAPLGRHQSADDGLSATTRAAIRVFGCDEGRVPQRADQVPLLGGPGGHG